MPNITTKDLHIFRGTRDECLAQKTEDMKIYLAWDTHEIFIGNGLGAKVKYGGSKDLTAVLKDEFEKYRILINQEIRSAIDNLSNDKVTEYLSEHEELIRTSIQNIEERVTNEFDSIQRTFDGIISDFRGEVFEKVDELNNSVAVLADIDIVELARTISDVVDRISELQNVASVPYVLNRISDLRTQIQDLYYDKETVDGLLDAINAAISELDSKVTTNTNDISALKTNVNQLNTNIKAKANKDDVYTKDEVENLISGGLSYLRYRSGSDISIEYSALSRQDKLSEFVPTFCTSTYSNYNMGSIYYYDQTKNDIVETVGGGGSSGGSNIQIIDAGVRQTLKLYNSSNVLSESVQYSAGNDETIEHDIELNSSSRLYTTRITIERVNALYALYINGAIIPYSKWSSGTYDHTQVIFTPNTPNDIISSTVMVVAKTSEDENIRYTASGNNIKFKVVQPTLFGNTGNYTNCGLSATGRFTASITPNRQVYLLTKDKIERISSSGFEVPFTLVNEEPVLFNEPVNGVSAGLYYYQYSLGNINDTTMTILVE